MLVETEIGIASICVVPDVMRTVTPSKLLPEEMTSISLALQAQSPIR